MRTSAGSTPCNAAAAVPLSMWRSLDVCVGVGGGGLRVWMVGAVGGEGEDGDGEDGGCWSFVVDCW